MDHGNNESFNDSIKVSGLPFKRKLCKNGNTLFITIPADYVKGYNLTVGKELQFYMEVQE